jgi:hypothetical protein
LFPEAQQTIPESRRRGTDAFLVVWLQVTEKHYLLPIPSTLQRRLLDDLDMVEEHKLLPLPRDPSFEHVLQRFEDAMLAGKVAAASRAPLLQMGETAGARPCAARRAPGRRPHAPL